MDVIYEDEYLAIINKPPGVEVSGNKRYTIANALDKALKKSNQEDALLRPEPIHRLDYPTSGCLLIGKTSTSVMKLNRAFQEKKIDKVYYAITIGKQKTSGTIKSPLDGKSCISHFEVIDTVASMKYEVLNLVKLIPETGRKHQLRKQLYAIGNPIYGDQKYKFNNTDKAINKSLMLHSYQIRFMIKDKKYTYTALLPDHFKKILKVKRLKLPSFL